jgi:predicted Fe-Mo cluster-binding NifX family protein
MNSIKVAVSVTDGLVERPGEGLEVRFYQIEGNKVKLLESYSNPALTAVRARGVRMLKSALEKGASAFIVGEMGPPRVRLLQGKAKFYLAQGVKVEEAIDRLLKRTLTETTSPTRAQAHH